MNYTNQLNKVKTFKTVQIEIIDKIAVLKFNRPEQLNAMNRQMMDEIIEAIDLINSNNDTTVAVISGEGRAFMAGADIKEYGSQTQEEFESFQEKGKQLYESIEKASKPWIATINGFALGGGFEIALSCDMVVASQNAKMGFPEVFLSLIPGGGGTQRLIQKIGVNRVKEMLFFGAQYDTKTLHEWGVVNRIFSDDNFMSQVLDFVGKLSRRPQSSIAELKRLANLSLTSMAFEEKIDDEAKTVKQLFLRSEAQRAIQKFIKIRNDENNGPLKGLAVADFSQLAQGPWATQMLGDMGADIIKIEPVKGDWMRHYSYHNLYPEGESISFLSFNRNKRSIALNLKDPKGNKAAIDIIAKADILVENFRPGVMDRLGLGYDDMVNKSQIGVLLKFWLWFLRTIFT